MSDGGIDCVYGSRGSGKSTLARERARRYKMAVAIDPAADWGRSPGWFRASSLKEVVQLIRRHWKAGKRIAYTPPVGHEAEALHHLSQVAFQAQQGFHDGRSSRRFLIVADEAAECYSNRHQEDKALTGFKRAINQGRHHGIDIIAITQRPQDLATRLRANADTVFAFRLGDRNAIKAVADKIGSEAGQLARFEPYDYMQISAGNVQKRRTKRPRGG